MRPLPSQPRECKPRPSKLGPCKENRMFLNHWKVVMAAALLTSVPALAADQTDQLAYCSYVMEQAQAQRDLLRTPLGFAGFTQPETGLPLQIVGGASLGLSNF